MTKILIVDEHDDYRKALCRRISSNGIQVHQSASFEHAHHTLKQESFEVVDTVAKLLKEHPEITRIRVDGHTDDVGKAETNLNLSDRRAAAVVKYLATKGGVERGRLESKGFGESQPVESNATALGRAKNRRVEFTVLATADDEAPNAKPAPTPAKASHSKPAPTPAQPAPPK